MHGHGAARPRTVVAAGRLAGEPRACPCGMAGADSGPPARGSLREQPYRRRPATLHGRAAEGRARLRSSRGWRAAAQRTGPRPSAGGARPGRRVLGLARLDPSHRRPASEAPWAAGTVVRVGRQATAGLPVGSRRRRRRREAARGRRRGLGRARAAGSNPSASDRRSPARPWAGPRARLPGRK